MNVVKQQQRARLRKALRSLITTSSASGGGTVPKPSAAVPSATTAASSFAAAATAAAATAPATVVFDGKALTAAGHKHSQSKEQESNLQVLLSVVRQQLMKAQERAERAAGDLLITTWSTVRSWQTDFLDRLKVGDAVWTVHYHGGNQMLLKRFSVESIPKGSTLHQSARAAIAAIATPPMPLMPPMPAPTYERRYDQQYERRYGGGRYGGDGRGRAGPRRSDGPWAPPGPLSRSSEHIDPKVVVLTPIVAAGSDAKAGAQQQQQQPHTGLTVVSYLPYLVPKWCAPDALARLAQASDSDTDEEDEDDDSDEDEGDKGGEHKGDDDGVLVDKPLSSSPPTKKKLSMAEQQAQRRRQANYAKRALGCFYSSMPTILPSPTGSDDERQTIANVFSHYTVLFV